MFIYNYICLGFSKNTNFGFLEITVLKLNLWERRV